MRDFTVPAGSDGKNVIRASLLEFPAITPAALQRALKRKDIRVNGKRIAKDQPVSQGDTIEIWLPDAAFSEQDADTANHAGRIDYKIVYESDRLLLINKRQGLPVHSGRGTTGDTLIDIIRKDQRNPRIDLCHRIDMNTGGILLLAKEKNALEDAIFLFKHNLVTKRYRCLVKGIPTEGEPVLCKDDVVMKEIQAFLEKPEKGNVFIHEEQQPGDLPIVTRYRILQEFRGIGPDRSDVSELEVELVTGRTHQIRAQFASLGHPILGDGNYGRNQYNRFFRSSPTNGQSGHLRYQQLFASSLLFDRISKENRHHSLSGRAFSITPRYDISFYNNEGNGTIEPQ